MCEKGESCLSEEERDLLDDLQKFFYSNKVPHLSVKQKYPGKEEHLFSFNEFVQEYIRHRLLTK